MAIILYDLCGANPEARFSPPCWLVKFALLHKRLEFDTHPLGFAEKENYPDPEYGRLPVIRDGDRLIRDSADIIGYLDDAYPDAPELLSEAAQPFFRFHKAFTAAEVFPSMAPKLFIRIHDVIRAEDKGYFRETRERRLGLTLEEAAASPLRAGYVTAMSLYAAAIEDGGFLGGEAPNAIDYDLASVFIWERSVSEAELLEKPAALEAWFQRMLDLFGGYARASVRACA